VIDVTPEGLLLVEIAPDTTAEEVIRKTGAPLKVAENLRGITLENSPNQPVGA
jgi:3-oxoacid CoA-transferase subunit B